VLSVFASIILVFVLFVGVQFGSDKLRKFAIKRKKTELKLRTMMGSKKAAEGLKTLKEIQSATAEGEKGK